MKKLFFILIAACIGFGGYFAYQNLSSSSHKLNFHHAVKKGLGFEKWTLFTPKEESFSAAFPKDPKESSRDLEIPGSEESLPYREFICELEGNKKFSVSYTTLPDGWLKYGNSLVLGGALKVIMKELGKVQLVGKESGVFKTFPSLDYEHYSTDTETAGTLVLVGNILYKIEMTYPLEMHDHVQDEIANFIENFTPISSFQSGHLESDKSQSQ